jgi:hypothetical protein
MFRIEDGRSHFYQWDSDIRLIVEDSSISEVHFCNRTDSCSLVCDTFVEDGVTLVNVPNILLQSSWRIKVYAFNVHYTKYDDCFEVKARTKPSDYVYTETEVRTFNALEERLEAVESMVDPEGIAKAVEEYMAANPVEIPEEYVTEDELTDYAKKTDIPSTEGLATEKYVDDAIADIEPTDLGNYYTKTEVDGKGYQTEAQVEAKGYQTEAQVTTLISEALANIGVAEEGAY